MSVTFSVFQSEISSEVSLPQPSNILLILVAFSVFQSEISSVVRLEQPWNILLILVASRVKTLFNSILVQLLKSLNSSEQSPTKLTLPVAVTLLTAEGLTSLPHLSSLLNSP